MLKPIADMPPGAIGFEAVGTFDDDDFEDAVEPVLRREIAAGRTIRLLYVLGSELLEYEGDALGEELKFAARHASSYERVAVVRPTRGLVCPGSDRTSPSEKPPSVGQSRCSSSATPSLMLVAVVAVASSSRSSRPRPSGLAGGRQCRPRSPAGAEAHVRGPALSTLQVPRARALRDGEVVEIPASELVLGDIVAGNLPVDGRIIRSSSLEVQEAALTGESAPVAKAAGTLPDKDIAVGDRANVLFQNTSVTRGTATVVVTETPTAATRPAGSGRRCSRQSPSRSLRSCSSCWPPRPPSCKAAS